jgi:hypothetical protein
MLAGLPNMHLWKQRNNHARMPVKGNSALQRCTKDGAQGSTSGGRQRTARGCAGAQLKREPTLSRP